MATETWFPEGFSESDVTNRGNKAVVTFQRKFGTPPQFCVRVPGRVNLIGEHIDYCGYGVFPMAIQQDILLACGTTTGPSTEPGPILQLVNTVPQHADFECQFKEIRLILDNREPTGTVTRVPGWHLYFLCGLQGILEHFALLHENRAVSMQVCLDGVIPLSAGLSSSSAVVCAAALATLVAQKVDMAKADLASLCAKSERYVGTEGGGMDQAISLLAKQGTAQLIEFVPSLHGDQIQLPPKAIFVIANSLAEANKAASATFNIRVAECRLATWLLTKGAGLPDYFTFSRLKDFQLSLGYSYVEMAALIDHHLLRGPYTAEKIAELLETDIDTLAEKPLMSRIPFRTIEFQLYNRAKHVIAEAERVYLFRTACIDQNLEQMGTLMSSSHWSLSQNYDCSHAHLDKMVKLSEGYAYGARLTGAGWGGCMVALVDESQLQPYLDRLKTLFYTPTHGKVTLDTNDVFVTQPGPGASAYVMDTTSIE